MLSTLSVNKFGIAFLCTALFICMNLVYVPKVQAAAVLSDGLVSCWSFEETSGDAADTIGSNTLVNQNGMPYTTGKVGGAADIDALNSITNAQYLKIDDTAQSGLDFVETMSISLWINFDSVVGGQGLVSKFVQDTNDESYALVFDGNSNQLKFLADSDGMPGSDAIPTLNAEKVWEFVPQVGEWYHIMVTYAKGKTNLYIDGIKQTNVILDIADKSIYASNAPFEVGSIPLAVRESNFKMDELGIWNRALGAKEVREVYNTGAGISCGSL
jgi:hypothetical protein